MKIKEASLRTNLTKKTIRYYEAEGLFTSNRTTINGKEYHDYTEENIQQLLKIATFRRARFTIDEIRCMQTAPDSVQTVFNGYRERLLREKRELDEIVRVARSIDDEKLSESDQLLKQMEAVTAKMPLPIVDVHPRFRYLDAIEDWKPVRKKKPNLTEEELRQRNIAAINAAMYAGFSIQNSPGNNMAAGGRGAGFDSSNAMKIAAYNMLKTFDDE